MNFEVLIEAFFSFILISKNDYEFFYITLFIHCKIESYNLLLCKF